MTSKIVVNNIEADAGVSTVTVIGDCQATTFKGDGSNLTSLPSQATIANNADNRVITGGSGVNLNGEANLTFTGSNLTVTNSSGASELTLVTPSNTDGGVYFNDGSNAGAVTYLHTDNSMKFRVNSTNKMIIASDGKIGINQTSPAHKLHVEDGSSGVIVA